MVNSSSLIENSTHINNQQKMTLNDLIQVVDNYNNVIYAPMQTGVRFGCDCDCGGDNYKEEEWDDEMKYNEQVIKNMKELCDKLGITYDGIE
jgi:hypothetical protein